MTPETLDKQRIAADIERALTEDVGAGDVTADLIDADAKAVAKVICREPATIAGIAWFTECFNQIDDKIQLRWHVRDGDVVQADTLLCTISGNARAMLVAERTALNFLQTLSGTATTAHRYADRVRGSRSKIRDTRKTLPGLRYAQKYAVTCGGCENHRLGLYDAVLIKENHIIAAGSIAAAVKQARELHPNIPLEVEVESIAELQEALAAGPDLVLLDNFTQPLLIKAVAYNKQQKTKNQPSALLEASGNVTLDTVRQIADTGVDYIAIGQLTKSVEAIDLSMRFELMTANQEKTDDNVVTGNFEQKRGA